MVAIGQILEAARQAAREGDGSVTQLAVKQTSAALGNGRA